nr:MAG TPA: hypothetical protein [Caudoviricetes sp.]
MKKAGTRTLSHEKRDYKNSAKDTLNKSDFCDKRLKYRDFYCKNNLKSEAS